MNNVYKSISKVVASLFGRIEQLTRTQEAEIAAYTVKNVSLSALQKRVSKTQHDTAKTLIIPHGTTHTVITTCSEVQNYLNALPGATPETADLLPKAKAQLTKHRRDQLVTLDFSSSAFCY